MLSVYGYKTEIEANPRRIETMEKYRGLINWGRKHPVKFIKLIFKIELMDYQKWLIMNTWTAEKAVWVCSRNAGKSFLLAVYIQARSILFPKHTTLLMAPSARQSANLFQKMEEIATHNIASLLGTSDVFFNEVVKSNANTDGFTHSAQGCECSLYNGSVIKSLVASGKTVVSFRSHLNVYDEAGKVEEEYYDLTEPFTAQNTDFKTGGGFDERIFPPAVPSQCIYASSAEAVDTHLWKMYEDCAKNMMMGIPGFFVADVGCEMPLHPKINGIEVPALLKQSEIDSAMRANESKALREYYNIFDKTGGTNAAVQRQAIIRNTRAYLPVFGSEGMDHKYVICWDPAAQADNSTVLIAELIRDKEKGLMLKFVNSINLIEVISPTQKRPLRTPEQIDWFRKIVLAYNGSAPEYQNVELYLDGGSGGGGNQIRDLLMTDWTDEQGNLHRGFIDPEDEVSQEQKNKFSHAVECLHVMNPTKFKTAMYTALGEMTSQDLIIFPDTDLREETKELENGKVVTLTAEEMRALVEFDLMKEEMMAMEKHKNKLGTISFDLPPQKSKKLHDDRSYCSAMCSWHLSEKRRLELVSGGPKPQVDYTEFLNAMAAQRSSAPFAGRQNPWANRENPFGRR